MKNILFDSYAILKFYQDEDGAEEVEKLLISSRQGDLKAFMCEINLGEVYYYDHKEAWIGVCKRIFRAVL